MAQAHELVDADLIFLSLPNGDVVRDVLLGSGGLLGQLRPGQTVVDTSTIGYATTLEIGAALAERGVAFLDAPVSGMEARAVEGTLTVMCGGDRAVFDRLEPTLRCFGNNLLYMGPAGSGQLTKLVNQLLFDIHCAAFAILPMAVKMGLEPQKVGAVVNSGTGRSYASEFFVPRMLEGDFSSGYPLKHAYKDLVSAAERARSGHRDVPDGAARRAWRSRQGCDGAAVREAPGRPVPSDRRVTLARALGDEQ